MACSATASLFAPGTLQTGIWWALAAARSMWSLPMANTAMLGEVSWGIGGEG